MNIRRAHEKDIPRLIELLEQVLQIHADIRPDIFIPGTTKYTNEELAEMIKDDTNPIYVAADDDDVCMGYAFCQITWILGNMTMNSHHRSLKVLDFTDIFAIYT